MEVQIREKCPHCENGIVSSWIWQEFFAAEKERKEAGQPEFTEKEMLDWFKTKHGYSSYDKLPPEEHDCNECEGSAILFRWVTLTELFELAHPIISKHWSPENEEINPYILKGQELETAINKRKEY